MKLAFVMILNLYYEIYLRPALQSDKRLDYVFSDLGKLNTLTILKI